MFGDKFKVTGSLHPQVTNTECLFEILTQKLLVKEALSTKHCLGLELYLKGKESNSLQVHFQPFQRTFSNKHSEHYASD